MKSASFKWLIAIGICTLAVLFATWWANGKNDTWLYVTSALIVASSFFYMSPNKKAKDQ